MIAQRHTRFGQPHGFGPPSDTLVIASAFGRKFVLAFVLQTIVIALLIVGLEQWRVRSTVQDELLTRAEDLRTVAVGSDNAVKNGRIGRVKSGRGSTTPTLLPPTAGSWLSRGVPPAGITITAGRTNLQAANGTRSTSSQSIRQRWPYFRLVASRREAVSVLSQLRWSNHGRCAGATVAIRSHLDRLPFHHPSDLESRTTPDGWRTAI